MGLEYFPCYHSYLRSCDCLTDEELGRLFRALIHYSETGERTELSGRESVAFGFIAADIDRSKTAYDAKCEKARQNIAKRYATDEYCGIRTNTDEYESYQSKGKSKSKIKEKDIDIPDGISNTTAKRFVVPSVAEVDAYCRSRGNGIDADRFVSYYESNGWMVGRNHMKDWKAAVRTWERKDAPQKQAKTMTSFYDIAERMKEEGLA